MREKGRRRSEEILDAATAILVEEGYALLSTRKIAARAGIAPGNLQYYYSAKQDVVRALLERWLARSAAAVAAGAAASAGTPEAHLEASLDAILAEQASDAGCRVFWDLWALAARDPSVAGATREFYDRYRDALAEGLRAVSPALPLSRAQQRATLLVALLEGLSVVRIGRRRPATDDPGLLRELRALVSHLSQEDSR